MQQKLQQLLSVSTESLVSKMDDHGAPAGSHDKPRAVLSVQMLISGKQGTEGGEED